MLLRRDDLIALAALLTLALLWASPLVTRLGSHFPGTPLDTDVATMIWNVGWVQRAIETPAVWFRSDAIVIPFGADLRAHTYGVLPAAVVWPVARLAGVVPAFNAMWIVTLVLNGWLGYWLFRELPVSRPAAAVAASALMLSGPVLDQIRVGRPIFAAIWFVCLAIVAVRRMLARPTARWTIALGAALTLALFTDLQMLLFTAIWITWLIAWHLVRQRSIDPSRALAIAAAVALALAPFLLVFYPAFTPDAQLGIPGPDEAVLYSYRWWDYLDPSVMPRALGGYELAVTLAAGFLLLRDPRIGVWWLGAALCLVLALGPTLKFTGLPLPFAWLQSWPPLAQFRVPSRLTIPAAIGAAAVMALLIDRLIAAWRPRRIVAAAAVAFALRLALAWSQHPLHAQSYPAFDLYRRLAAEPGAGALLEVPFGVTTGIDRIGRGEVLQYYQHIHGRPIVNAMVARMPSEVLAFYRRHPSLLVLAGEPTDAGAADLAADFNAVLDLTAAAFVAVHHDRLTPDHLAAVDRLLGAHPGVTPWATEGSLVVYRVRR